MSQLHPSFVGWPLSNLLDGPGFPALLFHNDLLKMFWVFRRQNIWLHIWIYIYISMNIYIYVYIYIQICICIYTNICICIYTNICSICIYTNMYMYIYKYICICIYTNICICIYTNICICIYTNMYMYIYICVSLNIFIYIYVFNAWSSLIFFKWSGSHWTNPSRYFPPVSGLEMPFSVQNRGKSNRSVLTPCQLPQAYFIKGEVSWNSSCFSLATPASYMSNNIRSRLCRLGFRSSYCAMRSSYAAMPGWYRCSIGATAMAQGTIQLHKNFAAPGLRKS